MQSHAFTCAMKLTPLSVNVIQRKDYVTGDEKEAHLRGVGLVNLEKVCTCDSATADRYLRRRRCYRLRPRIILLFVGGCQNL